MQARAQDGFTLIETMVASVLLLIGMAATLTFIVQAAATTVTTRTREQATSLQRELVEASRSVPYDQLTPNGLGAAVRARPALGDSSLTSAGWTIRRRNATYTVAMGVCTVDDPRDGIGPHEGGVFCAADGPAPTPAQCSSLLELTTGATLPGGILGAGLTVPQLGQLGRCGIDLNADGTIDGLTTVAATVCLLGTCSTPPDTTPADYKRIVSRVTWTGGANVQTSQINNPGLAAAPAVTALTAPTSVGEGQTAASLTSTTTNSPVTVGLYLDGTAAGSASTTNRTAWNATWNLGTVTATDGAQPGATEVLDGSYQLSEKAFDQYGQYGATRSQTVEVNRRRPFAPAHIEAGRNGSDVEVEWSPPKERDTVGFRLDRRVGSGAWSPVCEMAVQTRCRDEDAPSPSVLSTLEYSVVGFDRDAGGTLRMGDRSAPQAIPLLTPPVPGTPTTLQSSLANGTVTLTWSAPGGLTGVDHYNVYRDGLSYDQRLDSVYVPTGQAPSFTDRQTGGIPHQYWVTAVNGNLGESAAVGPVTR